MNLEETIGPRLNGIGGLNNLAINLRNNLILACRLAFSVGIVGNVCQIGSHDLAITKHVKRHPVFILSAKHTPTHEYASLARRKSHNSPTQAFHLRDRCDLSVTTHSDRHQTSQTC